MTAPAQQVPAIPVDLVMPATPQLVVTVGVGMLVVVALVLAVAHAFRHRTATYPALLLGAAPVLVLAGVALMAAHEYVRARATVSGLRPAGTSTIGDRTLRIAATLVFLAIAGIAGPAYADLAAGTSTLVLALWVLLALFGFVQLLSIVRKALVS